MFSDDEPRHGLRFTFSRDDFTHTRRYFSRGKSLALFVVLVVVVIAAPAQSGVDDRVVALSNENLQSVSPQKRPSPQCVEPAPCTKSVADFGAVGDGTTDDYLPLRVALGALEANDVLCFEENKTYLISDGLQIFGSVANDWILQGRGATLKMADGVPTTPSSYILRVRESSGWQINDLHLDGNRNNRQISSDARSNLLLRGNTGFAVCGVTSTNAVRDGFYVYGVESTDPGTFPENGIFEDCVADNSFRNGMSVINARDLRIVGGEYKNTAGTEPQAGIDIEPNWGSYEPGVEGITVQGVTFQGNAGYGLVISPKGIPAQIDVSNNRFSGNALGGVFVGGSYSTIAENLFENFEDLNGQGVIHLRVADGTEQTVIFGNTLTGIEATDPVIWVTPGLADGHEVTANCIEGFTGAKAIHVSAGSGVIVTENTVNPPGGCSIPGDVPTPLPCDLDGDGTTNVADVQLAVNQALGRASCRSADLDGDGLCTIVDVQRWINAAAGGECHVGD